MPVITTRESVATDLYSYGEDDLADKVLTLNDEHFNAIQYRADHYLHNYPTKSGASMYLSKALSLAAVEVLEGTPRELKWAKRKLNRSK